MTGFMIDFTLRDGSPLFKKFHMFNSGLAPVSRYEENLDALRRIRPESIRIDLFLGDREQEFGDVIDGTAEQPVYHYEKLDNLTRLLLKENIKPYWCWCYVPLPLQPPGGTFKHGPTDFKRFGDFLEELSQHYQKEGLCLGWQEVFNEADCFDNLYAGTFEDYLRMYEFGAPALKRGDPQAVVGGPAEAFQEPAEVVIGNLNSFIRLVREKKLPLDFISYHSYGYEKKEYLERTACVQRLLEEADGLQHVELHMNELNVLPPPWDYGETALTNETVVPVILDCMMELLEIHDLTAVHWAQLLNSGVGELSLVSLDGIYYPAFYVFEIYNRMPVGRCPVFGTENSQTVAAESGPWQDSDIKGLASADQNRNSALFWNDKSKMVQGELKLRGLCGEYVDIYICDKAFYDRIKSEKSAPLLRRERIPVSHGEAVISMMLEPFSMLYAECSKEMQGENMPDRDGKFLYGRQYYRFTDRLNHDSYACMEPRYHTFYLGTGSENRDFLCSAIQLCSYPERVSFEVNTNYPEEISRRLRVRMRTEEGEEIVLSRERLQTGMRLPDSGRPVLLIAEMKHVRAGLWAEIRLR